jgi:hypothetical protein
MAMPHMICILAADGEAVQRKNPANELPETVVLATEIAAIAAHLPTSIRNKNH